MCLRIIGFLHPIFILKILSGGRLVGSIVVNDFDDVSFLVERAGLVSIEDFGRLSLFSTCPVVVATVVAAAAIVVGDDDVVVHDEPCLEQKVLVLLVLVAESALVVDESTDVEGLDDDDDE